MASRPMLPKPKPDMNQVARKTAAAWNAPGGGYEQFKKMDPQREKDLPPGGKLPPGSTPGNYSPGPMKPISGVMHEGGIVPKTGAYLMKKGEHVLTPEKKNMMHHAMSLASTALSHPDMDEKEPAAPKKTLKEMRIRKGASGGHLITHIHEMPHPDEEHVSPDTDHLVGHVLQHMTEPNEGEMEAENGESGMDEKNESPATGQMEKAVGYK